MAFIWQRWNRDHLARHQVTTELAELIFCADDFCAIETDGLRIVGRGTVDGLTYRVVFIQESNDDIYINTCHREHPSRRFP